MREREREILLLFCVFLSNGGKDKDVDRSSVILTLHFRDAFSLINFFRFVLFSGMAPEVVGVVMRGDEWELLAYFSNQQPRRRPDA